MLRHKGAILMMILGFAMTVAAMAPPIISAHYDRSERLEYYYASANAVDETRSYVSKGG